MFRRFIIRWCPMHFFFLLFHQLAEDEALIIFLQTSLFLVFPYVVDNCMPLSSKSSLALSIHLFLCLPLLLSPLTCPCSAVQCTDNYFFHVSLSCAFLSVRLFPHYSIPLCRPAIPCMVFLFLFYLPSLRTLPPSPACYLQDCLFYVLVSVLLYHCL